MPKYLTLVSTHKPLGIAILALASVRLVVRLRYGAPSLPADLPEPMKLAAYLSHYAFYVPTTRCHSIRSTHCAREGPGSNGSPKY